jgi:uncharacterized membrane protein
LILCYNENEQIIMTQDTTINTGQSIRFGWETTKKNFWFLVGVALVSMIIGNIGSESRQNNGWDLVGFLASTWMTCGTTAIFLAFRRGQKPPFTMLFTTVERYLSVLGATILVLLIIAGGMILLIVPGISWAIKYQFTVPLIIDKKLGVMEAMRRSGEMTKGRKWSLFGFDLTMLGIVILGAICLGVGILVAMPVAGLALIDLYDKLQTAVST